MSPRGILVPALILVLSTLPASQTFAQSYDALEECTALSPLLDDIHTCLDNYLDIMDSNMAGITGFLAESLSGESLAGLNRSQQAFVEYRRQNCLWYLDFSSPRSEAEQIAKNCLVSMSQQRVSELQALLAVEDTAGQAVSGFYVYGPGRNSFQQCGSDERYWLEGDSILVSQAQQSYVSLATSELQVLHAVFAGSVNTQAQAPDGHNGVFDLTAIIGISLPTEADCRLPGTVSAQSPGLAITTTDDSTTTDSLPGGESTEQEEPQQQLIAYFGAWLVDCTENDGLRSCRLEVALDDQANSGSREAGELAVIRQASQASSMELVFPGREIDSPARIRWSIDSVGLGDIVGSEIRVDEVATRQLVPGGRFLRDDLLPLLVSGAQVNIEVLDNVDDASGEVFAATLQGLTRSLAFADDFVREAAQ